MSAGLVGFIVLVLLFIALFSGIGIGIGLMFISVIGICLSAGNFQVAVNMLGTTAYSAIKDYAFAVVPLFVLVGLLANLSGASKELYDTSYVFLRKVRGGISIATVIANAVFAAITGVSIASAAVFTKIAMPEMDALGYDKEFSAGTIAGSSVLGMLIPPSALMIIYGTLAETSIGKLFLGGVMPGILLSCLYIILILIMTGIKPELAGFSKDGKPIREPRHEKISWRIIYKPWAIVLLIFVTMGGIWGGFFTPTEAGGVGVFGAFILALAKRKLTLQSFWSCLAETGKTTGSILFLLISAQMFSRMLAVSGVVSLISKTVMSWGLAPLAVIAVFCLIHIAMGCVLDSTSILLLTMPLMVPIVRGLGFDTVWYGIVAIVAIEMGLISPPFGISVFTVKSSLSQTAAGKDITVEGIFRGSVPFLITMFICLIIIVLIPPIITFLPNHMATML